MDAERGGESQKDAQKGSQKDSQNKREIAHVIFLAVLKKVRNNTEVENHYVLREQVFTVIDFDVKATKLHRERFHFSGSQSASAGAEKEQKHA